MIHHLKICFLTHGLDLADHLIDKAFLDQLICQVRIENDRHIVVCLCHKAVLLRHIDQQIFLREGNLGSIHIEFQRAVCLEGFHGFASVYRSEVCLDTAKLLAIFRAYRFELRLEAVACERGNVLRENDLLHIQLILNDILIELSKLMVCLYIHRADRLTVLDVCRITCCTTHDNDLQDLFHILFQLLVDVLFICCREVAKVDALRCALVNAAYQILIDLLCHERDHRRSALADRHKRCVKRHISVDLILLHAFCPETFTASSDIPVAHLIHKVVQYPCSLRDPVMIQVVIHFFDRCI